MSCLIVGHYVCAQENEQNLQRLVFGDVIRYDSSTSNGMARNYRTQWIMEGATRLSRGLIFDFTRLPFLKALKSFCFELSSRKPRAISTSNECYWLSRYDKMVSERHEIHILTVPTGTHRDRLRTARYRPKRLKNDPDNPPHFKCICRLQCFIPIWQSAKQPELRNHLWGQVEYSLPSGSTQPTISRFKNLF